ncbi:AraC family transcriptional regulator [Paenibacillus glycanilyticus]|uniref:AraC family transcriptional regulator n=1 Tax=Paenibacillus glycanilyticus TaxID=126569 RepID=A0ABQ6NNR6_9BACL|nr:response regulator [Paenibacillus glycanilyticus]GMK46738.1 AraC family transcriptional regulator [Paenibacillus glycanilyticus]
MYKVLLVDDEIFVRKGLKNLIDWESLGYEICDEAGNGQEALEKIQLIKPDLVIADIRMPVLDGLGLIQKVTEEGAYSPTFIIVSGYHDFQYAQRALRYGVHDYILKPIDEEELETTLKALSGTLGLKKLATIASDSLVTDSIVETLVQGQFSEADNAALCAALQMPEFSSFDYVLVELHASAQSNGTEWQAKELAAVAQSVSASPSSKIPVYEQANGLFGLLIDQRSFLSPETRLESAYNSLHAAVTKTSGRPATLYIGKTVERLQEMYASYRSANEAMSYKYAEQGSSVIYANQVQGTPLYYFDVDSELYGRLLERLEENNVELYEQDIELLFRQFVEKRFAPNAVANTITRFVIGIINIIRKMEGDEKGLSKLPLIMDWQGSHSRLQDLKGLFTDFLREASAYLAELRNEQSKGGIERIKKYIEANYTENISLKSIAGKFYMNSVYLGQLFRKTYGTYFNDFLLQIRIGEAKKLLRQTDFRMYEIAEKVGFQNADYFVTQFEKLEKVTPTDYRNKLLGKK